MGKIVKSAIRVKYFKSPFSVMYLHTKKDTESEQHKQIELIDIDKTQHKIIE